MNIVIDSNILFSALIKKSITRKIILDYPDYFLFPSFIFEEMEKHHDKILKKSKMTRTDFDTLLSIILRKVMIVPTENLIPYKEEALKIVGDIDKDDALFIACALCYQPALLWTDDKQLKKQSTVSIIDTSEMFALFYK